MKYLILSILCQKAINLQTLGSFDGIRIENHQLINEKISDASIVENNSLRGEILSNHNGDCSELECFHLCKTTPDSYNKQIYACIY